MAASGPLAGIKVLDFTQALAGPFCTQNLADLGAEVIKIETRDGGDLSRSAGPFRPEDTARKHSGYFHSVNRNKTSVAADLKTPEAVEMIKRLIPTVDVVVENFRPGVMDRLGLSYETLRECNPALVYGAVRGFGDPRSGVGAYADWPAYDVVAQAMGGMMGVTGTGPGHPMKVGPGVGDTVPGLYLALGIVSALLQARTTGEGQFVDVSMVDAVLAVSERIVHQHAFGGLVPTPEGNHHPFLLPFGIYPASDGHVAIACPGDRFFRELARALGADDLLKDPRFADVKTRGLNREAVIDALSELTACYTKAELAERLGGIVPFGPVYNVAEIFNDEHFAIRKMLPTLDIAGLPPVQIAGQPLRFSATPETHYRRGPDLGEHADVVLRAGGVSDDDIARWRAAGAIS